MQKNELLARINFVSGKIEDLEQQEESLIRILSFGPEGGKIFCVTLGMKVYHFELSAAREQIYNLGLEHCDIISSLRQIDSDLASKLNLSFSHKMLMRLDQLRLELRAYDAKEGLVKEKNEVHANCNRELIAKIKQFFDYYPGC
ncbi:hypothetical protein BGZ47_011043 [Haplosporangium gracile]|nr:hypothetical protein BGZ47_011043 [Haplosporangium gracile]